MNKDKNKNKDIFLPNYPINNNLDKMTQPEYKFNYNDIMYLGGSINNKVNKQRELIQNLLNYAKAVFDNDVFLLTKTELVKPQNKLEQIDLNSSDIFDYIDKNELDDEKISKLVGELENKNLDKKVNPDAIKRFVKTVKLIYATNKLLNNVRPILENTFKEIGIDINEPDVIKYLDNIEKGLKDINELIVIIKNNNVILTDEQNLVILNFLNLVLENFFTSPIEN